MPPCGICPIIVVYLTPTERDRLIKAIVGWPDSGSSILTLGKPGIDGQLQLILLDPEPSPTGTAESSKIDKSIVDQIGSE